MSVKYVQKDRSDTERLAKVFPCLMAYHQWLREFHTWPDGTYWSSGLGCGMDNLPRTQLSAVSCKSAGRRLRLTGSDFRQT